MASIAFQNISKRFGEKVALDDVSFEIEDNEFFCFFGPPLSGKSTILRLILGLDKPDSGNIVIDGRKVNDVGPADRNIAMVFQNLALFPHMTARDNVAFPLIERGVAKDKIDRRVEDVAEKLHMSHILHKHPAHLSGGERQRVAIARALVRDPVAYLMDDPISALDARLREETRIELKRIQREMGHTLIYVTHDQEEAMSIADRIAILREGTIQQIGTPIEIYDQPANTYVASILGAPAINLFDMDGSAGQSADGALRLKVDKISTDVAKLGLRPEDTKIVHGEAAGTKSTCVVEDVEPLGGFTIVTLRPPDAAHSYRVLSRGKPAVSAGADVAIDYDPGALIGFDQQGNRVAVVG